MLSFSRDDVEYCRKINQTQGPNYYVTTLLYPTDIQDKIFVWYAFFREADEIVDNPPEGSDPIVELNTWWNTWQAVYEGEKTDNPVIRASVVSVQSDQIPKKYIEDFIKAIKQDNYKSRYQTYAELEDYMYGSAVCVGLITSHIIGFEGGEKTLSQARKLGEAMQLTNFLRDIKEDVDQRDRIYMPLDELAVFDLSEKDIVDHVYDDRFVEFMKFQVKRARRLFAEAEPGIDKLHQHGRKPVRLASRVYERHLDHIERSHYDVYTNPKGLRNSKLYLVRMLFKTKYGI